MRDMGRETGTEGDWAGDELEGKRVMNRNRLGAEHFFTKCKGDNCVYERVVRVCIWVWVYVCECMCVCACVRKHLCI